LKRVLIPVDGSTHSLEAVRAVLQEGPGEIAHVDLLNVQPMLNRHISGWIGKQQRDAWRADRAQAALQRAVQMVAIAGIPLRTHVAIGPVATAIAKAARELRSHEIVIAARRRNPLERLVANCVSARLLEISTIPVRVIPCDDPPALERIAVPAGLGLIALLVLTD
jgi:nucleotide-binding universal stress UspA family protein